MSVGKQGVRRKKMHTIIVIKMKPPSEKHPGLIGSLGAFKNKIKRKKNHKNHTHTQAHT